MRKKTSGTHLILSHDSNKIYFKDSKDNVMAETNFKTDIYSELLKVNWYISFNEKKNYVYTGSTRWGKAKRLHQVIMLLSYGEIVFQESLENNVVIDHLDNKEHNNLIENLAFAPRDFNLAKGLIYDKQIKNLEPEKIRVHWYKDFKTRKYQFIIVFNNDAYYKKGNESYLINRLYLIYDDNYRIIYEDASSIVCDLLETRRVNLKKLRYMGEPYIDKTVLIDQSKIKKDKYLAYDEKGYFILLKDKVKLNLVKYN